MNKIFFLCIGFGITHLQIVTMQGNNPVFLDRYYKNSTKKHFIKNDRCTSFIKGQVLRRTTDSFFDEAKKKEPLAGFIFGKDITMADVSLISKLSAQGAITLPGNGTSFGALSNEQYISCLSSAKIDITASVREVEGLVRYMRYFYLTCDGCLMGALGAVMPICQVTRNLDMKVTEAFITCGVNPTLMGTVGENNIGQFFSDYGDVDDFFKQTVLDAAGLQYKRKNNKVGLGDITVLGWLDITNYIPWAEDFNIGINAIVPSGSRRSADILWDSDLGNGGAPGVEFFTSGHFNSYRSYLNPFLFFEGVYFFPFTAERRIPRKVLNSNAQLVGNIPGLVANNRFKGYQVLPFYQYNTQVAELAPTKVKTRISYGSRIRCIVGNYWRNIFDSQFTLGFFYDMFNQDRSYVRVKNDTTQLFNTKLLENLTDQLSHAVGWSISFYYNKQARVFLGSRHVVGGRNTPAFHSVFASLLIYF